MIAVLVYIYFFILKGHRCGSKRNILNSKKFQIRGHEYEIGHGCGYTTCTLNASKIMHIFLFILQFF